MHKRLIRLGLLAAAAVLSLSSVAAEAQVAKPLPGHAYIDPFANPGWQPDRTDMGVDWFVTRPLPVLAIGNAVIVGSNSHDGGWPGGHFIWYRLVSGSHAGDIIYVAEHLKHLLPAGSRVRAGQKIAEALPGGTGTEWGWADADGTTRAGWGGSVIQRGRADRLGQGDGALHEISWGRRSRPPGSRTGCAVRKALLTDGT